ncbi:MAG: DUF3810 domain-containing protein [Clostridiales bacterium]|jgi:hypothetical protein|nr:DUF3810 domain-containing protein [Clostridiales bacterium]
MKKTAQKNAESKKTPGLKGLTVALGCLLAFMAFIFVIRQSVAAVEWITMNITRHYVYAVGSLTELLPFSIFEWGVVAAVAAAIILPVAGVVGLKKKKYRRVLRGFLVTAVTFVTVADLALFTGGMGYFRAPIALPIYGDFDERYGAEAVERVGESFLYDFKVLRDKLYDDGGNLIEPYTFDEINGLLKEEYKRLDENYFFAYTPPVKCMVNDWFMSWVGTAGVAAAITSEANIAPYNLDNPTYLPVLMAHELAHVKGIVRENEADLTACYLLITSENEYLRYCGYRRYLYCLGDALNVSHSSDPTVSSDFWSKLYKIANGEGQAASANTDGAATVVTTTTMTAAEYAEYVEYSDTSYDSYSELSFFDKLKDLFSDVGRLMSDTFYSVYGFINGQPAGKDLYKNPYGMIYTGKFENYFVDAAGRNVPGTGTEIVKPIYSDMHKLFFSLYESRPSWLTDNVVQEPGGDTPPSINSVYVYIFDDDGKMRRFFARWQLSGGTTTIVENDERQYVVGGGNSSQYIEKDGQRFEIHVDIDADALNAEKYFVRYGYIESDDGSQTAVYAPNSRLTGAKTGYVLNGMGELSDIKVCTVGGLETDGVIGFNYDNAANTIFDSVFSISWIYETAPEGYVPVPTPEGLSVYGYKVDGDGKVVPVYRLPANGGISTTVGMLSKNTTSDNWGQVILFSYDETAGPQNLIGIISMPGNRSILVYAECPPDYEPIASKKGYANLGYCVIGGTVVQAEVSTADIRWFTNVIID